jgi:cob(I)alamin adenosyltransferase
MKSFVLPGGHMVVSTAHVCRCVCRRAERSAVQLDAEEPIGQPLIIKYLNRLSDYLFILSRYAGHQLGAEEVAWKPRTHI